MEKRKIYLASSWRNLSQPQLVADLRGAGFEVYDFKHPEEGSGGFSWKDVSPDWTFWSPEKFVAGLQHPVAEKGFQLDMDALDAADITVLLAPSGRSAHLEAGYALGKGQKVFALALEGTEVELMWKMFGKNNIFTKTEDLLAALKNIDVFDENLGDIYGDLTLQMAMADSFVSSVLTTTAMILAGEVYVNGEQEKNPGRILHPYDIVRVLGGSYSMQKGMRLIWKKVR